MHNASLILAVILSIGLLACRIVERHSNNRSVASAERPSASGPCAGKAQILPGDHTRSITVGAIGRDYLLHIPPGYSQVRQMPVVLNFHGGGGYAGVQERITRMNDKADAVGYIVVYPEGTKAIVGRLQTFNGGSCCGRAERNNVDDVAFTAAILDDLTKDLCIDPRRVYATGLSNGAMMAYRLACEFADRVAAIAAVAGVLAVDTCTPDRPVSVMHFHGTADQSVPYDGGPSSNPLVRGVEFKSVSSTIGFWVKHDKCPAMPKVTYQKGDVVCESYEPCQEKTAVTLCTINGGGHTWPGGAPYGLGGKTSYDISATEEMFKFFEAHPMPEYNASTPMQKRETNR